MTRPSEIVWFERLMFGSLALGIFNSWWRWPELLAVSQGRVGFLLTTQLLTLIILSTLYLWISRGRSVVGKWIAITLFVLGIPFSILAHFQTSLSPISLVFLAQTAASLIAYGLLFTQPARVWFNGDREASSVFE